MVSPTRVGVFRTKVTSTSRSNALASFIAWRRAFSDSSVPSTPTTMGPAEDVVTPARRASRRSGGRAAASGPSRGRPAAGGRASLNAALDRRAGGGRDAGAAAAAGRRSHAGDLGGQRQRVGDRQRDPAQQVALAGAPRSARQQVPRDAVGDVDQADVGVHEHLQPAVEEREQEAPGAAGAARPLDRGRIDAARGPGRPRARRPARPARPRSWCARRSRGTSRDGASARRRPCPGASPIVAAEEVWTSRADAGARRRAHGRDGAVDVRAPHRPRVLDAQRVDAGDVERQLAAAHPLGERVARRRPRRARPRRRGPRSAVRRGVGAGQRRPPRRRARAAARRARGRSRPVPPVTKTRATRAAYDAGRERERTR